MGCQSSHACVSWQRSSRAFASSDAGLDSTGLSCGFRFRRPCRTTKASFSTRLNRKATAPLYRLAATPKDTRACVRIQTVRAFPTATLTLAAPPGQVARIPVCSAESRQIALHSIARERVCIACGHVPDCRTVAENMSGCGGRWEPWLRLVVATRFMARERGREGVAVCRNRGINAWLIG